jgi:hypothetical protein
MVGGRWPLIAEKNGLPAGGITVDGVAADDRPPCPARRKIAIEARRANEI